MSQSELQYNNESEIDGPDDVELPRFAHHLKIRAELNSLVEMNMISNNEADELYDEWRATRQ